MTLSRKRKMKWENQLWLHETAVLLLRLVIRDQRRRIGASLWPVISPLTQNRLPLEKKVPRIDGQCAHSSTRKLLTNFWATVSSLIEFSSRLQRQITCHTSEVSGSFCWEAGLKEKLNYFKRSTPTESLKRDSSDYFTFCCMRHLSISNIYTEYM